jgi:hypothetical protein
MWTLTENINWDEGSHAKSHVGPVSAYALMARIHNFRRSCLECKFIENFTIHNYQHFHKCTKSIHSPLESVRSKMTICMHYVSQSDIMHHPALLTCRVILCVTQDDIYPHWQQLNHNWTQLESNQHALFLPCVISWQDSKHFCDIDPVNPCEIPKMFTHPSSKVTNEKCHASYPNLQGLPLEPTDTISV